MRVNPLPHEVKQRLQCSTWVDEQCGGVGWTERMDHRDATRSLGILTLPAMPLHSCLSQPWPHLTLVGCQCRWEAETSCDAGGGVVALVVVVVVVAAGPDVAAWLAARWRGGGGMVVDGLIVASPGLELGALWPGRKVQNCPSEWLRSATRDRPPEIPSDDPRSDDPMKRRELGGRLRPNEKAKRNRLPPQPQRKHQHLA